MPRSRAICACDLLLDRTSWTASILNSRVKVRCSFCMILSLSMGSPLFQVYFLHFSGSRPACSRCPRKRANPLVCMGLEHGRSRPNGFTPLAPEIAWSTHLVQAALGRWEIRRGWQGALASSLPCAIHVEDEPVVSLSIPQSTHFFLLLQRSGDQVFAKHRTQCFNHRLIERRKKAVSPSSDEGGVLARRGP